MESEEPGWRLQLAGTKGRGDEVPPGMPLTQRIKNGLARLVVPNPTGVPHAQVSLILYDDRGLPTGRLVDVALGAIQHARHEDLSEIANRMPERERWPNHWPGEHYKLLTGIVRLIRPRIVIEIGTFQGLSALTLARHLPEGGAVHTFDIVHHSRIPGCVLRDGDLREGRIKPIVADLTRSSVFEQYRGLFEAAELIFVDAAKDGVMEQVLLDRFESVQFQARPLVVFDDIRVWNMLKIWRNVRRPKLDLTSFGHWSGTGIIDWVEVDGGSHGRRASSGEEAPTR